MKNIIVDTGVWISLVDKKDKTAPDSVIESIFEFMKNNSIIILWPIAYETLRTRLVRNKDGLKIFERTLSQINLTWIDDTNYRNDAFELTFREGQKGRDWSMVDCAIRLLIADRKIKIDSLLTFNERDFYDVCAANRVSVLTANSDWR